MENNIFKPTCENKAGRILFYTFEIAALVVFAINLILGLVVAIQVSSFATFISGLIGSVIYALGIYAVGRVIDLLYKLNEKN
ncbi:MAG: hypothetical protein IJ542_01635 [Clostridia bacterium]|nr:hypothetical protein [Clostridia bacterium]